MTNQTRRNHLSMAILAVVLCSFAPKKNQLGSKLKSPIKLSRSTSFITKPTDANGLIDYFEALNRKYQQGVTDKNSAAIPFWNACGPKKISSDIRKEFYRRLGIKPLPIRGSYFVSANEASSHLSDDAKNKADEKFTNDFEACLAAPWSAEKYPDVYEWLKRNILR